MLIENAREILEAAHAALGKPWEAWADSFMKGTGKQRLFGNRKADWTSLAAFGRGVLGAEGRCVGLYLEPYCFSRDGTPERGVLLEMSALVPIHDGIKDCSHERFIHFLADHIADEYVVIDRESLVCRYPNRIPRADNKIHLLIDGTGKNDLLDVDPDSSCVSEDEVWITVTHVLEKCDMNHQAIAGSAAVHHLRACFPLFRSVVDYVRGAVVDRRPSSIDPRALLGWCGEYVYWARSGAHWRGGYSSPFDFEFYDRTIEVKSTIGLPPADPIFSFNELNYAVEHADTHDVLCVGIDGSVFEDLRNTLMEALTSSNKDPLDAEWVRTLQRDVKIPSQCIGSVLSRVEKHLLDLVATASTRSHSSAFSDERFRNAITHLRSPDAPSVTHGALRVRLVPRHESI